LNSPFLQEKVPASAAMNNTFLNSLDIETPFLLKLLTYRETDYCLPVGVLRIYNVLRTKTETSRVNNYWMAISVNIPLAAGIGNLVEPA
jgi:hypothetical protein